jgi:hypothetical protein
MSLTKVSFSMISGTVVNVLDFGADPTGVADSTTAIQAAIDSFGNTSANTAGSIYFPRGTYKVSSQIVFNGQTGFVIFGQGKFLTTIVASNWTDNTKPIFKFVNGAYCSVKEMSLNAQASGTQVKSAIEVQVSAPITPTPQGMIFENLHIDGVQSGGFSCGIRFFADAGQDNNNERAFFNNCDFSNCNNGISIENYNSLLHQIFGGVIGSCGVGINTSIGLGGSFSATGVAFIQNSIADFKFANNDTHPIDIVNCKSEATTGYWIWTTNAATRDDINVVNSTYHGTTTGAGCILYAGKGHLNLNNCDIYTTGTENTIITNNANSSLNIIGCNIYALASINWSGNLFMAGNKYVDGTSTTIIPGTPKSLVYLDKDRNVSTGIYTITTSSYAWNNNPIINSVIANYAGTVTLVLPNPALYFGLVLNVRTITANAVVADASVVVPITGGAAGTAILPATAGAWATLQSDGINWITMAKG